MKLFVSVCCAATLSLVVVAGFMAHGEEAGSSPRGIWLETGSWILIHGDAVPVLDLTRERAMGVFLAHDGVPRLEFRDKPDGAWRSLGVETRGGLKSHYLYRWEAIFPTPEPSRPYLALPAGQRYHTIEIRNRPEPGETDPPTSRLVLAW